MQIHPTSRNVTLLAAILLGIACVPLGGCRICGDCEDLAYPAYGGSWQRTRRYEGRVGSVFDPAGGKTSPLVERDAPPDPDQLERDKQGDRGNLFGPEGYEPRSESDRPSEDVPPSIEDLRNRNLDDIPNENEEDLRNRNLDNINLDARVERGRIRQVGATQVRGVERARPSIDRRPNPNRPVTSTLRKLLPF